MASAEHSTGDDDDDDDDDDVQLVPPQRLLDDRRSLQVTQIRFSDRAKRRLSRHARAARVIRTASNNLALDDECRFVHDRGNLQVTYVRFSDRAERRLSSHARAARVGGTVSSNLALDDECSEVLGSHFADEISSGEDAALPVRRVRRLRRRFGHRSRSPFGVRAALNSSETRHTLQARRSDSTGTLSRQEVSPRAFGETTTENLEAPSFYLESFSNGAQPRCCTVCHEFFLAGQLRLGLCLCAQSERAETAQGIMWLHAPRCIRRANFRLNLTESLAFHASIDDGVRSRILEELAAEHARQTEDAAWPGRTWVRPPRATQPWRYGEFDNSWMVIVVDASVVQADPETRPVLAALDARSHVQASFESRWAEIDAQLVASRARSELNGAGLDVFESGRSLSGHENSIPSAVFESIPLQILAADDSEPCVICCEQILAGDEARRLPCLHLFHRACIDKWLLVKACCPLDNLSLKSMLTQDGVIEADEAI